MTDVLQATLLYETDRKVFFLDTEIGFCVSHLEVKTLRKKIQTDGEQRLDSAVECVCRACRKLSALSAALPSPSRPLSVTTLRRR